MAVVGALEFAIIELDIDRIRAFEADLALHDGVFGGEFQAVDGRMRCDGGLAVGGRHVHLARLGASQCALLEGESVYDLMPALVVLGALEVVGEEQLLLVGNRPGRHRIQVRR